MDIEQEGVQGHRRTKRVAKDEEQVLGGFRYSVSLRRHVNTYRSLVRRDRYGLRHVRVHVADGRVVSAIDGGALQVVRKVQRRRKWSWSGEGDPPRITSLHHVRRSVHRSAGHHHLVALDALDENTAIEFPIRGIGHHEFQMVGLARLNDRFGIEALRQTIILEVLSTSIVVVVLAVRTIVHIVDRHRRVGAGNKSDVVVAADTSVAGYTGSADEEAEDVVVLRSDPLVVFFTAEHEIEAQAISARDDVELEHAGIARGAARYDVQQRVAGCALLEGLVLNVVRTDGLRDATRGEQHTFVDAEDASTVIELAITLCMAVDHRVGDTNPWAGDGSGKCREVRLWGDCQLGARCGSDQECR